MIPPADPASATMPTAVAVIAYIASSAMHRPHVDLAEYALDR